MIDATDINMRRKIMAEQLQNQPFMKLSWHHVGECKKLKLEKNLENAADAQQRFMIPDRDHNEGSKATPAFVRTFGERSEEILREGKERVEKERREENDPSKTKFWR